MKSQKRKDPTYVCEFYNKKRSLEEHSSITGLNITWGITNFLKDTKRYLLNPLLNQTKSKIVKKTKKIKITNLFSVRLI